MRNTIGVKHDAWSRRGENVIRRVKGVNCPGEYVQGEMPGYTDNAVQGSDNKC